MGTKQAPQPSLLPTAHLQQEEATAGHLTLAWEELSGVDETLLPFPSQIPQLPSPVPEALSPTCLFLQEQGGDSTARTGALPSPETAPFSHLDPLQLMFSSYNKGHRE